MKNFLKQHGLWVLFAAAVLSVAMAVMSVLSANSSPLVNLTGILVSPFRAGYTVVANWFNDLQNYYKDTTDLQAENAASDRAALLRQKGERNKAISKAVRAQEKLRRKGLRHIE